MNDTFVLGSIPSFSVWESERFGFIVTAKSGGKATFKLKTNPVPKGTLSIDERSGRFEFTPLNADREDISVTISARTDSGEESQTIWISPVPRLPSDFRIIRHKSPAPKAHEYITVIEQPDPEKRIFNNVLDYTDEREAKISTSQMTISGIDLVFERDSDTNLLFKRINGRKNLRLLTICADIITIRSEIKLPGTEVRIFARLLRFEDRTATDTGCINTTPESVGVRANVREEGLKGQKAGDVYLNVDRIETTGTSVRIIARGGTGQPARLGKVGKAGKVVTPWDGKMHKATADLDFTDDIKSKAPGYSPLFAQVWANTPLDPMWNEDGTKGTNDWPTDGSPPELKPGFPGQGGDGGVVFVGRPDQLGSRVSLDAGSSGAKADNVPPSAAGQPEHSCHVVVNYKVWAIPPFYPARSGEATWVRREDVSIKEKRDVKAGPGADAPTGPNPATPAARAGAVKPLDISKGGFWLHPATLRTLITYGNDATLAGFTDSSQPLLASYRKAIESARLNTTGDVEWSGLHTELCALLQKIDSPYDFFGNPAGWVPMLSLESNLKLYEQEIESSIRTMFLAYWMQNIESSEKSATAALDAALTRLEEEGRRALEDYNAAQTKLIEIDGRLKPLKEEIEAFYKSLQKLEAELRKQAATDLQTEHLLRAGGKILGGVMQLIPVGQPVLGAFGKGLTELAEIDLDKPFETVPKILGAFSDVAQEKLLPKAKELYSKFDAYMKEEEPENKESDSGKDKGKEDKDENKKKFDAEVEKKKLDEKVKKYLEEQKEAKNTAIEGFSTFAVSADEIKERMAKVTADCPQYKELAKKLESLNAKKAAFMEETLAALRTIDESATTIITGRIARIDLRSQLDKSLDRLNPEVFQHARSMGQRARNRLVKYQYYLLKSYQFLMVDDLAALDFRVNKMFQKFATYLPGSKTAGATPSPNGELNAEQFKAMSAVFEDQLREIVGTIIDFYQGNPPKFDGKFEVGLTKPQLELLNSRGRVEIDLLQMGYHDLDREDIRIINIEAKSNLELEIPPSDDPVNVHLTFRHEGTSYIRRGGKLYVFRSGRYRVASDGGSGGSFLNNKIYWGTDATFNKDAKSPDVTHRKPDEVEKWLVRHLLGENDRRDVSPLTSYRPSAWAKITVTRSATPVNSAGKLKRLELRIGYASHNLDEKLGTVFVRMPVDVQALVRCNVTDVNGVADGQGSFLRTFDASAFSEVTFSAPARFGEREFKGWLVNERAASLRSAERADGAENAAPLLAWARGELSVGREPPNLRKERALKLDFGESNSYTIEPYFAESTT